MRRTKLMTLVMVCAMAGFMIMPGKVQAQARPTSIAVADVAKIMGALEEMTQMEADAKTQIEQIKIEHESRRKNLKQMQEDLELLQQGTDAFMQKAEDFQLSAMQLDSWFKYKQARMGSERVLQVANIYRKLTATIGKVASEAGYDMVLFKEKTMALPKSNMKPDTLSAMLQMRKVIWVRNDLDITDQIVLRMNNEWKNRH